MTIVSCTKVNIFYIGFQYFAWIILNVEIKFILIIGEFEQKSSHKLKNV